jgi:hypothetical protein
MSRLALLVLCLGLIATPALAASQQDIQQAIDDGLAWLATQQQGDGRWLDANGPQGWTAATGSAALALLGEGYRPGDGSAYDATVTNAINYLYNWSRIDGSAGAPAENLFFHNAANLYERSVYTTGIVAPVIYELGKANPDAVISAPGTAVHNLSYKQVMQRIMNWFTWGQNPDGGWRYWPNYGGSDNSTAQWGALPYLYGEAWGLATPTSVKTGLANWTGIVQNPMDAGIDWRDGGSGYSNNWNYCNMAKTGGMLLEFAVMDLGISDTRVQDALYYMSSMEGFDHWNEWQTGFYSGTTWQWWGGNLNNPYAMWAVFKGLDTYGGLVTHDNGTPADPTDDFLVGKTSLVPTAPGGLTIGQDWAPTTSAPGDWYSHYCDLLVGLQNIDGSWNGAGPWTGPLATGWYINILNAAGAPPPFIIPEPGTIALFGLGLLGAGIAIRRRRRR